MGGASASARSTRRSASGGGDQTRATRHQTHEAHFRRDRDQRPSGQIQSQPRPPRLKTAAYDGFGSDDARSNTFHDNNNNKNNNIVDIHTSDFDYYPDDHPAPSSPAIFTAGATLPRTSSLLPPTPRNLGHAGRVPLSHISTSNHNNPPTTREPSLFHFLDPEDTPRRSHSRSSSSGAVSDSFRNLNRWSASTASTRTSRSGSGGTGGIIGGAGAGDLQVLHQQQPQLQQSPPVKKPSRLANFSRRMSVDSVALLTRATADHSSQPSATHHSPRRLAKRRPSNASSNLTKSPSTGSLASSTPTRLHTNNPAPPPYLPPIIALPVLQLPAVNPTDSPISLGIDTQGLFGCASPAVGTPVSALSGQTYSLSTESSDRFWDDQADRINAPPPFTIRGNKPALLPSAQMTSAANTMPPEKKGHTRSRSSNAQSSSDSTNRTRDRVVDHRGKQPSQKAMLSKALAKANTAVQLDNAQNYEGARHSYNEACSLLQQVLDRTTGDEDKKKLEAIRRTYTSRIEELDGMVPMQFSAGSHTAKALPARPESLDYNGVEVRPSYEDDEPDEPVYLETATTIRGTRSPPPDRRNLTTPAPADQLHSAFSRSPRRRNFEGSLTLPRQEDGGYLPAPLSPRRAPSPSPPSDHTESVVRQDFSMPSNRLSVHGAGGSGHSRNPSHESTSWLDPIDESGGSAPSSVHSRTSSFGVRRRHIRSISGDTTEAEFDTALDAAIEAAYDDGYEPNESSDMYDHEEDDDPIVAQAMRRVEWAKEQVRQSEREAAIGQAREKDRQRRLRKSNAYDEGGFYNGSDSEEEERMLEEFTRNYAMQNFSFDQPPRQQAGAGSEHGRERESDSSGVTQRTWHSSMGSNPPPTASTVLSTVTELPTPLPKPTAPASLPPSQALPQIPLPQPPSAAVAGSPSSVRGRRLSGQNPKQLKIETSKITAQQPAPGGPVSAFQTKAGNYLTQQRQAMSATTSTRSGPFTMRASGSPPRGVSPAPGIAPPTPTRQQTLSGDSGEDLDEFLESPTTRRPTLRKNQSSSSLRSLKTRQFSAISSVDTLSDLSPNTSYNSSMSSRQPAMPALPTPVATAFSQRLIGGFGGLYLFDSDFHSPAPHSPGSVHQTSPDAPLPLEPCPADAMLRPFWLMRALYQTLSHQRGGYVTNRLFIPRDVWKVKGVKLRAVEDKSSQCDLLTAALLKLQRVDSNDADAVLEEMQSFETVLEQVQMTLNKKLGNEVGTQGMSLGGESDAAPAVPRSASVSSKGSAFSWRRLRNKGSAANMSSSYGTKGNSTGSNSAKETIPEKEVVGAGSGSMPSLPMVAQPSGRPAKRDVGSISFDGPYAGYMASLARLFDAAQAVDQIARQVDDPGLRHADKTQVGLELCTRHAAEFFGFYICRFVLADLGLLLDKFVKRGSEWVLT